MILYPMLISAIVVFFTLFYASYLDIKNRRVPFTTWYPMLIVGFPASIFILYSGFFETPLFFIATTLIFCVFLYILGKIHVFGGADVFALICISLCVPIYPFTPMLGMSPTGFFAVSVLINSLLISMLIPIVIFSINALRGNNAPLICMFSGFPVNGNTIRQEWGFVMEEFEENGDVVTRKFIGAFDSIKRMYTGKGRIYTKDLREHPAEFALELSMYRKAGTVWISYAVPFIIPITIGFVSAIVFGDFLFAIIGMLV